MTIPRGRVCAEGYDENVVLRPRKELRNSQGGGIGAAAAATLASILYSLKFHGVARVIVVVAGVALAVAVIGLIVLSLRRTKLTMIGGQLKFTGVLRDRVVRVGSGAGRVVEVEVEWGKASGRRSRLWLLVDAAGRAAVVLNRNKWDAGQLEALRERLGLTMELVEMPQRPAELRKTYPGIIPWWTAHPSIATVLTILALTVAVLTFEHLAS
jgi:hypothetical protein